MLNECRTNRKTARFKRSVLANPTAPLFTAPADRRWVKTPIGAFVLHQLQKEGLKPSPEADRATLIRRVCMTSQVSRRLPLKSLHF